MTPMRLVPLLLCSCSLVVADAPDGGVLGNASTTDAGEARDAGVAADTGSVPGLSCAEGERADEIGRVCVPMTGTRTCEAGASVDAEHAWLKEASAVLYAAPQAAGDGSGSDAGNAGSLEAMVAAAGAEATAVLLAPGIYTLSDPLALAAHDPTKLKGPRTASASGSLSEYVPGARSTAVASAPAAATIASRLPALPASLPEPSSAACGAAYSTLCASRSQR